MLQHEAEQLAIKLMDKHGITKRGWRFEFDNAVKRFGVCRFRPKIIGLSKKLVELNGFDKVKDTILHEIAHAIAGHGAGHGPEWQEVCVRIGAIPRRCYSNKDTNTPMLKYHAKCDACGKEFERARIKYKERKRSCTCQAGINWNDRVLLEYKPRY